MLWDTLYTVVSFWGVFEVQIKIKLETLIFSLETPRFSWAIPKFSLKTPIFSLETFNFALETPSFSLKALLTFRFRLGVSNENPEISNENLGVSYEILGILNENLGVSNENMGSPMKGVFNSTPIMQIFFPDSGENIYKYIFRMNPRMFTIFFHKIKNHFIFI